MPSLVEESYLVSVMDWLKKQQCAQGWRSCLRNNICFDPELVVVGESREGRAVGLTREGSSGSGVRGEPSGEEGQLRSLALVTSPSARASNEGNPSSSTGMLSRVSVSTASKLASFSSSIFLGGGKGGRQRQKNRDRKNRTF